MRILIVTMYFWPENFLINSIVKSLSTRGEQVMVLTGKPNYPRGRLYEGYRVWGFQKEIYQGVQVFRVPTIPRLSNNLFLFINYLSFVVSASIFAPFLFRSKKFDVIFVYAPSPIFQALPAIILGRILRCPVVLWVQDLWPESLKATGTIKNRSILKFIGHAVGALYSRCDLILVQSIAFIESVSKLTSNRNILYHPNTVDDQFYMGSSNYFLEASDIPSLFTIAFAGNIGRAQNVEIIVEAAELLKDNSNIRFVLYGDGSRLEWIKNEILKRGLKNIEYLGWRPVEAMPSILSGVNALLVTLADDEIFRYTVPSKIQAYLAVGRPIIASLDGEGARIINAANAGITSPAGDAKGLAQAILRMYQLSPSDRSVLGENGRAYFKKEFDMSHLTSRLIGYFNKAILEYES